MKISIDLKRDKKKPKAVKPKRQIQLSKRLLYLDYIIAIALLGLFLICELTNGIYSAVIMKQLIESGIDVSAISIQALFNLDMYGVLLGIWIAQLGISTGFYYGLTRAERKMEMPMMLLDNLPEDVKSQLDMTTIVTTVLTSSNE